jgi:hypothetical protein
MLALGLSGAVVVALAGAAEASAPCRRMVFRTGPKTIMAGAVSTHITIEARKQGSTVCTIPRANTVSLAVSPASGGFYSDAAGSVPITSTTLSMTSPHRATFYYSDTLPGGRLITVTHAALGSVSQTEQVVPGPLDHFAMVAPAETEAGSPFSVALTAKDHLGNTITGYLGTVHFSTSDAQGVVPGDYTFTGADAGTHTFTDGFTLNTTGSPSIQAADGTIVASKTVDVRITHQVTGSASGTADLEIIPNSKTCTSPAIAESDHFCQYNIRGTYDDDDYLGSGSFTGRLVLDDRSYGPNATYGLNCYSNVDGIVKFTNADGTLRVKIDPGTAAVCDETSGGVKDIHFDLLGQPGGNVGSYSNVTGGSLALEGTWTPAGANSYAHSETFGGTIQST